MIENYLKILEQNRPRISSIDEKEINLFKKTVLAGSQTAFDTILEFSRRKQLDLYKDINLIIDPDALLIEMTDKNSPFKNKDTFDDAMMRLLMQNTSNHINNQKFQIDPRGSFFENHKEYLFEQIQVLIFKQSFLENFEHSCENGLYENYYNNIFEIIMIYGFEFLQFEYKKHKEFRKNLYFHGFLNTDILWFFKGWGDNYIEIYKNHEKELDKLPMLQTFLPPLTWFKNEEEKEIFCERDLNLILNKWNKIRNLFLDTIYYSGNKKTSDYLFHFKTDKKYLPLKLTYFGKYFLSSLISIIRQSHTFLKNPLFYEPPFTTEYEIREIIKNLLPLCDQLEIEYPDLKLHTKNQLVTYEGGFDVGFIMRDKNEIDIDEELQNK